VKVGDRCYLGASLLVCHTGIILGDDVVISWNVTIVDHDSHALDWERRKTDVTDWAHGFKRWDFVTVRPIHIGNKVWIGFGASILKGVTVGEGAVIGAHSVVTHDVPPFTVVAGNPARIVRKLNAEDSTP
jgi:galactoside O-acetyltransferase